MYWLRFLALSPFFLAALMGIGLAIYGLMRRNERGSGSFFMVALAFSLWSLGYALELQAHTYSLKLFWANFKYIGIIAAPLFWLIFVMQLTGQKDRIKSWQFFILWSGALFLLGLVWSDHYHHLVRASIRLQSYPPFSILRITHGIGDWLIYTFDLVVFFVGLIYLQRDSRSRHPVNRHISVLLFLAGLPSITSGVLYLFDVGPLPGVDWTSAWFVITYFIYLIAINRYQMFDFLPVARQAVIVGMSDLLIVLDANNRVVEINPAAQQALGVQKAQAIGKTAAELFHLWPDLVRHLDVNTEAHLEGSIQINGATHSMDMRISPLFGQRNTLTGRLLVLRDITRYKDVQNELQKRLDQTLLLYRVIAAAASIQDPSQVMTVVCRELAQFLNLPHASFAALDQANKNLVVTAEYISPARPSSLGITIPLIENDQLKEALAQRQALWIPNALTHPFLAATQHILTWRETVSMLCVPVVIQEQIVGFLNLHSLKYRQFTAEEIQLAESVAASAATVFANARLFANLQKELGERARAEAALRQSEERYRLLIENQGEGINYIDKDECIRFANPAAHDIFGVPPGSLVGRCLREFTNAINWDLLVKQTELRRSGQISRYELEILRPDSARRNLLVTGRPQYNQTTGAFTGTFAIFRDITERKRMEAQLRQLNEELEQRVVARTAELTLELERRRVMEQQIIHDALHDGLTGLPNRTLLLDRLERALDRFQRNEAAVFALLYLDFDRFKNVNDSLGHSIGDQMLVCSAGRLQRCIRSADTIARVGGDEFVILLEDIQGLPDAVQIASRILSEMETPFKLDGRLLFNSVSIGITLSAPGYLHPDDLMRDADIAMYRAKARGRSRYEVFDSTMRDLANRRMEIETDLRQAIEQGQFVLHYQPIISLDSGRLHSFEALLRWQHPHNGLVSPEEFIPVAEETGLIIPLGQWALTRACQQLRQWQQAYPGDPPLMVSVNLSVLQFAQPDIPDQIDQILNQTGLSPSSLNLEITESALIEDDDLARMTLDRLHDLGVRLQIDDFGTGYSSLSYLHQFPIGTLKIDRSFINKMTLNTAALDGVSGIEIVRTIITLARELQMQVVAEGVETPDQVKKLRALGCDMAQGYLISRPLDTQAVEEMLQQNAHRTLQRVTDPLY